MSKISKSSFSLQNFNFPYNFFFDQNRDFVLGCAQGVNERAEKTKTDAVSTVNSLMTTFQLDPATDKSAALTYLPDTYSNCFMLHQDVICGSSGLAGTACTTVMDKVENLGCTESDANARAAAENQAKICSNAFISQTFQAINMALQKNSGKGFHNQIFKKIIICQNAENQFKIMFFSSKIHPNLNFNFSSLEIPGGWPRTKWKIFPRSVSRPQTISRTPSSWTQKNLDLKIYFFWLDNIK